jgi:DNA topoisomerase-1
LFQYVDERGRRQKAASNDVNDYLREISGEDFTAKDFRTWAGTVLCGVALAACKPCVSMAEAKGNVVESIKAVARQLRNTPAVCRKCYVHPELIDAYLNGARGGFLTTRGAELGGRAVSGLRREEVAVLALLKRRPANGGFMSTRKQAAAARRNIRKAVAAAKRKQTVKHLPKPVRTALGKEGAKAAKRKRR